MVKESGKYESVGGPIPNTYMKVVHPETRSSLAARQMGETCVRGPQVGDRELSMFFAFHTYICCSYLVRKIRLPLPVGSLTVLT